jgi:hypothetical protein
MESCRHLQKEGLRQLCGHPSVKDSVYHTNDIPASQKPDGINSGLTISSDGRACGLEYGTHSSCNKYTPE